MTVTPYTVRTVMPNPKPTGGFVYLATNPHLPGLVKIGKAVDWQKRMSGMNKSTGMPGAFACRYKQHFKNSGDVERQLKDAFNFCRITDTVLVKHCKQHAPDDGAEFDYDKIKTQTEFFQINWRAPLAALLMMKTARAV